MNTVERKFDWDPNHDPRSRNFAAVRGLTPTIRRTRTWSLRNPILDQGSEGACVGHGVINAVSTPRLRVELPNPQQTAFGMYYGSRFIDEWPGEEYDGTSVLAGCKLAVNLGFASGYRWAFGAEEVAQTILDHGPVVIGIPWRDSMYDTKPNGLVEVSGSIVGGHCLVVTGFWRDHPLYDGPIFRWRNSWGLSYGIGGHGYVPLDQMSTLLAGEGEAAVLEPV